MNDDWTACAPVREIRNQMFPYLLPALWLMGDSDGVPIILLREAEIRIRCSYTGHEFEMEWCASWTYPFPVAVDLLCPYLGEEDAAAQAHARGCLDVVVKATERRRIHFLLMASGRSSSLYFRDSDMLLETVTCFFLSLKNQVRANRGLCGREWKTSDAGNSKCHGKSSDG